MLFRFYIIVINYRFWLNLVSNPSFSFYLIRFKIAELWNSIATFIYLIFEISCFTICNAHGYPHYHSWFLTNSECCMFTLSYNIRLATPNTEYIITIKKTFLIVYTVYQIIQAILFIFGIFFKSNFYWHSETLKIDCKRALWNWWCLHAHTLFIFSFLFPISSLTK